MSNGWSPIGPGQGGAGANINLSNLSSVAVNTDVVSDADSTDSLGSSVLKWLSGFLDKLILGEAAAPSTPATGDVSLYAKTDGLLYSKDDAGAETLVSGGAGGGATQLTDLSDVNTATTTDGNVLQADGVDFESVAPLNSSAGAGDAGKLVKLDAGGQIDATMINDADIDHGTTGGLTDDDHSQYPLLVGRATGQTLVGGTASGEDLTLQSTADATKGAIVLDDAIKLKASTILTLSTDAVTVTGPYHIIAAQSGTADDLATITASDDRTLLVIQADTGDTITVKDGTGNIQLNGGADFSLTGDATLLLFFDGTNWADLGAGGGAGSGATTELDNLGTVAINTSLISDTDNTDDLGTSAAKWKDFFHLLSVLEERTAPGTPATGDVALYAKTDGLLYSKDDAGAETLVSGGAGGGSSDYILIREEQTANTHGGTFTLGAWRTRVLNTESSDDGGHASLSSNQITLAAGDYVIHATAPAYSVNGHKLRLYNVTDSSDIIIGTSEFAEGGTDTIRAVVSGKFTIAASKALELQHWGAVTVATFGLGVAVNMDSKVEVYSEVQLWKVG